MVRNLSPEDREKLDDSLNPRIAEDGTRVPFTEEDAAATSQGFLAMFGRR